MKHLTWLSCSALQMWIRIDKRLGNIRIDKLQPKQLLEVYQEIGKPGARKDIKKDENGEIMEGQRLDLSGTSVRKHHIFLNSLLNQAVKWNFLAKNPCKAVEPPKAGKSQRSMLDEEQLALFLDKLQDEDLRHRCMVFLGLTGGLCREEIFGLRWGDIDLAAGTVTVDRARVYVARQGVILKDCKNTYRHRQVSIPPDTAALLKQHRLAEIKKKLKQGSN
ncbi:MAG: tyrosine-type recombinase/integrase [Negativicutes bacterium]|nr:tyrosine-type recombinase/integrase [Negativicutes bacterium]